MPFIRPIKVALYNYLRKYRWRVVRPLIQPEHSTLLDIGCQELYFYEQIKDQLQVTLADFEPQNELIQKADVQDLPYEDNEFDVVLCQQVLEHVLDPVKAIGELQRVAGKRLIISVPYEPFFTVMRCLYWEREHLWAVTPRLLKHYLGEPVFETKMVCKRYYLAAWDL
jgi:ubiquinone/menaquinone biosynthesis C-methylase UbiE